MKEAERGRQIKMISSQPENASAGELAALESAA
jgi:hypothetical protein